MTQPVFGSTPFAESAVPNAQDAFDLITGEQLQNVRALHPERSFLWDENVQAVAARLSDPAWTSFYRESQLAAYVGKWIVVAFNFGDHRSRFGMEIVTAQRPADERVPLRYGLTCIFDTEPWGETIATYRIGSRMTVVGQIEQLNVSDIRLRNCEIV